jgi:hypothetical protein
MLYERRPIPVSREFQRELYWIVVALGVWLAISIWGFCGSGFTALVMAIISLLIAVAVGLASLVGLIIRRRKGGVSEAREGSFAQGFEAHTGRLRGAAAAMQVILSLAAEAFGMTIFAVVHHLDVIGALASTRPVPVPKGRRPAQQRWNSLRCGGVAPKRGICTVPNDVRRSLAHADTRLDIKRCPGKGGALSSASN